MNKLLVVLWLVGVCGVLGGCALPEDGDQADDVASQVSAVEQAPAPQTDEELQIIRAACGRGCSDAQFNARSSCTNIFFPRTRGDSEQLWESCFNAAGVDYLECLNRCDRTWGGHY